jgi:hypothetical protein
MMHIQVNNKQGMMARVEVTRRSLISYTGVMITEGKY